MKAKQCRWTLVTVTVLSLFASVAHAADLTLFVGGAIPGRLTANRILSAGQTYQELKNGPVFGLRFNTNFARVIGLEHTLGFSTDYLTPKSVLNISSSKGFIYNTNLMVNLPIGKAVPYATAGLGLIHQYGSSNLPIGTRFAFNYGGGLKFPRLAGPLGLRFDVRGYRAASIGGTSSTNAFNIFEASGGILLSFGKH
jgi:hypothetical protein